MSFGLKPRKFLGHEELSLIYDEGDEVQEMYFIVSGDVGVGYPYMQARLTKKRYKLTHVLGRNNFFQVLV